MEYNQTFSNKLRFFHVRKCNVRKQKKTRDNLKLTEIYNTHYINIAENSSGIPPSTTDNPNNPLPVPNSPNSQKQSKNTKITQALLILETK